MSRLKLGATIKTILGEDIKIVSCLGEGGQGYVYKVKFRNHDYALKWYKRKESDEFYKNIEANIKKGSPASTFLWPIAITRRDKKGCFGYVMEIRPNDYEAFPLFLLNRVRFSSFSAIINAALLITVSFKMLHNKGFSYQDLNDGNFFIRPSDGRVLICDNDNVAPDGVNLGILGKARYMAPEIVSGKHRPDVFSDRFSLAVILFLLFFRDHPLAGKLDNDGDDPVQNAYRLYCENPIFVFDTKDTSNRPKPDVNKNVLTFWPVFPKYIRDLFVRAFDKSLMNPDGFNREDRIIEKEWIKNIIRLRKDLITCPCCKEETFFPLKKIEFNCMNCNDIIKKPVVLVIKDKEIPLYPSSEIYKYDIDSSVDFTIEGVMQTVGIVIKNKNNPNIWGIKNLSDMVWYRRSPGGKEEIRKEGEVIPVIRNNTIKFGTLTEGTIK